MTDKDMNYLSTLASSTADTAGWAEAKDQLTHKLLYLILEEAAATRKRTEQTNLLLVEISESLKKSTRAVKRLARETISYHEGDWHQQPTQD